MTTRKAVIKRGSSRPKGSRLNQAARIVVEKNAETVADALFEAMKKGHTLSSQILLQFAQMGVDLEAALNKKPVRTLAMRLSADRQLPRDYPNGEEEKDSPGSVVIAV